MQFLISDNYLHHKNKKIKFLIFGNYLHHKNKKGLEMILQNLNWSYKYASENIDEIKQFDIIYSPDKPINTSLFPNKKFIFGPHFSVLPDNTLHKIKNIHKNSIYIQPSEWVSQLWRDMKAESVIPIKTFSFPVNIDKFKPNNSPRDTVFIYFKERKQEELNILTRFLNRKNIKYKIFDYNKKYNENDYIKCLQKSKYGIWLGRHESQGFALEEALSMDVPLLVWNVKSINQEEGQNYPDLFGTTIPYFSEKCGDYFYDANEFESKYKQFINKLNTYKPREYILENLTTEICGENLKNIINEL